jgi:alpha-L-fucosidase
MRYLVFTAKHHDGFCNWPTETTDHSIQSSPWLHGNGDMVAMVAEACRDHGLAFGLYASPWDRHEPCYDDAPAYDRLYSAQWTELLTRYGDVACVWLDGAGSKGHVYNWQMIIGAIRKAQPETCIFSIGEPDCRWVGNEDGLAPDPCWCVVESQEQGRHDFYTRAYAESFPHWCPAECDARIRANWFWNTHDLPTLKSTERLIDIYRNSVGRGANLLLNVGPDTRGLLPEPDVERLAHLGRELDHCFGSPVAEVTGPAEKLQIDFDKPTRINQVVLGEDISQGQRIREYRVGVLTHGRWEGVAVGSAIGHKRIETFPTMAADGVAITVLIADGDPVLSSLQAHCI